MLPFNHNFLVCLWLMIFTCQQSIIYHKVILYTFYIILGGLFVYCTIAFILLFVMYFISTIINPPFCIKRMPEVKHTNYIWRLTKLTTKLYTYPSLCLSCLFSIFWISYSHMIYERFFLALFNISLIGRVCPWRRISYCRQKWLPIEIIFQNGSINKSATFFFSQLKSNSTW